MNYDNWKLSSPNYSDDVSTCCGAGYEETDDEIYETNYICDKCKDACDIQDEKEYEQDRWESYQEDLADDRRHGFD
jgi:hypothetical protein|tara:strand:- start:1141 stop:1368 length:228 start_codon:yes stop_codon:yes gene_type:complete